VKDWRAYRRTRLGWYSLLERQPAAYCGYRRLRHPTWPVVGAGTDVVIEGRPGCGNSFAREAMLLANPGIRVASHVHSPAQVLEAIRLHKPVLVIVRDPLDAIVSEAARFEDVDIRRDGRAAIPSESRAVRGARVRSMLDNPRLAELVRHCSAEYARFAALEPVSSAMTGEREPIGVERAGGGPLPGELGGAP
jgi:hypothetical protein